MLFWCFLDAFLLFFGSLLVAFWEPLGPGLLELLGSCGKDLGCFFVFFYWISCIYPASAEQCWRMPWLGWVGRWGRGGLAHALQSFFVAPPGFYICS